MSNGLFRSIMWNHAVSNNIRGRLCGNAMISYMTGPLLGNTRAGWVVAQSSVSISLWTGGVVCRLAVIATGLLLPKVWEDRAEPAA